MARRAAALFAVAAAAACASAPRSEGAPSARPAVTTEALPSLPVSQVALGTDAARRIQRFDAVDQDLRMALRGLAESFGLGLDLDPDVHGLVNARLEGVTLEEALGSVLARFSYAYQIQGGVLRVTGSRLQSRNFSLDYVSLSRLGATQTSVTSRLGGSNIAAQQAGGVTGGIVAGGGGGGGGVQIQSSTAANLWQDIRVALDAIVFYDVAQVDTAQVLVNAATTVPLPPGAVNSLLGAAAGAPGATAKTRSDGRRLIINPIAGSIYVTASPATLAEVESYIRSFEASVQRQVLVEAKIVRVSLNREFRFGIDWSVLGRRANLSLRSGESTSNTVNFTIGGGSSAVTVALHALEAQGDVAVLSSPMITALNNQVAVFDATSDEVFFSVTSTPILGANGGIVATNTQATPQQISVGIVLNVLAQIGADNVISMQIRPQLSEVARVEEFITPEGGKITAPVISRRETDTMARVRGGETIVIGGLTQTRRDRSRTGIPGLSRLPGIGGLFGGTSDVEEKDELVIFLTPTIIVGARTATP